MAAPLPEEIARDPYAALRVPSFRRFLIGNLLLQFGTAAQGVALGWQIYSKTGQSLALAWQGLVEALPMLLFTLPAGYLADVVDRKKLVFVGGLVSALSSFLLGIYAHNLESSISTMYALLFLDATALRLLGPASAAMVPLLVPSLVFENSVKWRTGLFHTSALLGPAFGGFLVAWHPAAAYFLSAGTGLFFAAMVLTLKPRVEPQAARGNMVDQVLEGLRFVWANKLVLSTLSLDLFAVLLGGAVYLLPVFARDLLNLSPVGITPEEALGWLRAAPAFGAMVVSFGLAYGRPFSRAGRAMLMAVAMFGLATIVFGMTQSFWLAMVMLALTGALDNVSVVVRQTLVQLATPNELRGRVSAINSIFIGSSNQLGGFESGLVAHFFGPRFSVVAGGVGTIVVVIAWSLIFPVLRRFGTLSSAVDIAKRGKVSRTGD